MTPEQLEQLWMLLAEAFGWSVVTTLLVTALRVVRERWG